MLTCLTTNLSRCFPMCNQENLIFSSTNIFSSLRSILLFIVGFYLSEHPENFQFSVEVRNHQTAQHFSIQTLLNNRVEDKVICKPNDISFSWIIAQNLSQNLFWGSLSTTSRGKTNAYAKWPIDEKQYSFRH